MKCVTLDGSELHAPSSLISVRRNEDAQCTVWVGGTCVGRIDQRTFDIVASMIYSLEKRNPLGPEFVLPDGPRMERLKADWTQP